ncbi:MAG: gliding motility lipoprotein GldD [Bacteroidota bacterium]
MRIERIMVRCFAVFVFALVFCGCGAEYLPKPKGYNRIDLPPHSYQTLPDSFPYTFQYSQHSRILRDSSWIAEKYWISVLYPEMGARIQITYKPVVTDSIIREYLSDSYRLTSQHNIKAYSIEESILELPSGLYASFTELEGEVPTQAQFHVSDSVNHFLRGALYFNTATKNDSLAPVISYIKKDILQLLQTLDWR